MQENSNRNTPKFILVDTNSNILDINQPVTPLGLDIKNIDIQYGGTNNEHIINLADASALRFTSTNGINFIQSKSEKNILRISPYFSPINLLEVQRRAINIGDKGEQNTVDLNINGVVKINGNQVIGDQIAAISDELPMEEKVAAILGVLRSHGLIKS